MSSALMPDLTGTYRFEAEAVKETEDPDATAELEVPLDEVCAAEILDEQ